MIPAPPGFPQRPDDQLFVHLQESPARAAFYDALAERAVGLATKLRDALQSEEHETSGLLFLPVFDKLRKSLNDPSVVTEGPKTVGPLPSALVYHKQRPRQTNDLLAWEAHINVPLATGETLTQRKESIATEKIELP
jgi:hypothetical protein